MTNIELVLTDFDGTVVELGKHVVSDKVRQTVIACEEKGVKVVPVTGRYYEMARPVLELLGFDSYGIFDNGASIRNCVTGELLWKNWLEPSTVQAVASILAPHSVWIDYDESHDEHEPADNELERISMVDQAASHVFAIVHDTKLDQIEADLAKISGLNYYMHVDLHGRPGVTGIQVTHHLSNKFHGAEALRELIGVSRENTLAIGDSSNDEPLFENAAIRVAMGNAEEALKAKADYITGTVQNDGRQ